jgi:DNA-binding NarL/FixJ family response regulator
LSGTGAPAIAMTFAILTLEASFLSLSWADAPLLFVVVPIAMIGRRWGSRRALWAAIVAVALVLARAWILGAQIGIVGYLSRATAFVTVALLADRSEPQPHRTPEQPDQTTDQVVSPPSAAMRGARPDELELLSQRELEVLAMVALGATNAEIAGQLVIAETTVQSHVKHILHKLGVRNRTQAAVRYVRR